MQKHSDAPFATSSTFPFTQPDWIEFYLPVTALGLLGTFIILANSFVIGFYKAKWREAIPLMYIMIAVCDSVTGLMAICHAGMFAHYPVFRVLANGSVRSNFKADTFLVIVYIILQSCTRTSLLYNTVLAVVRTINITKPFLQIKRSIIITCVILYPIMWVIILVIDEHLYVPLMGMDMFIATPGVWIAYYLAGEVGGMLLLATFLVLFMILPLAIPTLTCFICAVLQIYTILKPSIISPSTIRERNMTVTIIMLTTVCLVCNISYTGSLFSLTQTIGNLTQFMYICYTLGTLLPFLNAMLNPVILLLRGAALRRFVVWSLRRPFNRGTTAPAVEETELDIISQENNANNNA